MMTQLLTEACVPSQITVTNKLIWETYNYLNEKSTREDQYYDTIALLQLLEKENHIDHVVNWGYHAHCLKVPSFRCAF